MRKQVPRVVEDTTEALQAEARKWDWFMAADAAEVDALVARLDRGDFDALQRSQHQAIFGALISYLNSLPEPLLSPGLGLVCISGGRKGGWVGTWSVGWLTMIA